VEVDAFFVYNRLMNKPAPEISEVAKNRPGIEEEPPYRVIIHNDDVTPMNFVIYILQNIFLLAGPRAVQVMFNAHIHGSAYVETLPKTEALHRIHRAHVTARLSGFPLLFTLESE
jgi:ATP-dependent Clp protease adaptor protein ClpS